MHVNCEPWVVIIELNKKFHFGIRQTNYGTYKSKWRSAHRTRFDVDITDLTKLGYEVHIFQ